MEDLLWLTMGHQFIRWGDATYQVMGGSGIGQTLSGHVADLSVYRISEAPLHSVGQKFGLIAYVRYRDDILAITEPQEGANELFAWLTLKAKQQWRLERDSRSRYSLVMLDTLVYKGPRHKASNVLDYVVHLKPSGRHVPLSDLSAHHPRFHRSWPIGEMRRIAKRCFHKFSFE